MNKTISDITVINARSGWIPLNIREMWQFRELLYFLAWRNIKVKYKQTALGVIWAILQPILAMLVFSFIFGSLAKMPTDGVPYPLFVLIGLLPWNYFAGVLGQSTSSLVAESNLITKIYFPRLLVPASDALSMLLDFFITFLVLGLLLIYYSITPGVGLLLVPLLVMITLMNALGFGLWFSALNVRYRDIQYIIPFLIQIWMFATPVIYPKSLLGGKYGWILLLNPMGGVIEAFRPALLGHLPIPWTSLAVSTGIGFLVFAGGLLYFRRVERHFADVV
ncbi:MAG: ABC transporter permease [Thermodesulfobacteriota bacterium]